MKDDQSIALERYSNASDAVALLIESLPDPETLGDVHQVEKPNNQLTPQAQKKLAMLISLLGCPFPLPPPLKS